MNVITTVRKVVSTTIVLAAFVFFVVAVVADLTLDGAGYLALVAAGCVLAAVGLYISP